MSIQPLWRLTIYAPSNEDSTETTVLHPLAGAAHSDAFIVTSRQGVAGSQPYLGLIKGRQGSLDYTSKKTTTGNLTLSVFDPRVTPGGSNAVRWSTAFLGDAFGRTRFKGCKWTLELSTDGTAGSLAPFMAGRIRNTSITRPQWLDLDVKDFADDLNRPLFTGAPHTSITYAALGPLLPNGVVKPFGNLTLTPPLAATIGAAFATAPNTVVVNVTSPASPAAMITKAVLDSNSSTALRLVELTIVATGVKHYYQWPRGDAALASTAISGGPTAHFGLTAFPIAVLPSTDYRTFALPTVGTAVTVSIVLDAPPTASTPILVNDVHPVQYIADLLDGKFSCAPGSSTLRPLAVRNTGGGGTWATLLADPSFGLMREVIEKHEPKANDYLEKVLLQRYNLALVRDASGHLDIVDLRRSASLASVVTLTDADLADEVDPTWADSRDGAVTAVVLEYWMDQLLAVTDLVASGDTFPSQSPALFKATKSSVVVLNDLSTLKDVGEKIVTIAARGDRVSTGDWDFAHFGRQRLDRVQAVLTQAANDFLRPIGSGTVTAKATYRLASTNVAAVKVGTYALVQHTKLPDPSTNQRGAARLMLCLARDEQDGRVAISWLDAGSGTVCAAPSITSVTSANPYSVDVTLAANGAGDPIDVHVAVTDTSVGTHPAATAAEWIFAAQTAAGTIHIANLPAGKRVWVRAQSYGNAPNTKLPSVWVYAALLDLASGSAVDLSPPDAVWSPIANNPPAASLDFVSEDDTQVTLALTGALGAGDTGPLQYATRVGTGAWSSFSTSHPNWSVTRAPKLTKMAYLQVKQGDGQLSQIASYAVTGAYTGINTGTGEVDPTVNLSGTAHFIPRATDVGGMILHSGTTESGGRPLTVINTALDGSGFVQTGVNDAATIGSGKTALEVGKGSGTAFWSEAFDTYPAAAAGGWQLIAGARPGLATGSTGSTKGKNVILVTSSSWTSFPRDLLLDPRKLYRMRARVYVFADGGVPANQLAFIGVQQYKVDGTAANVNGGLAYVCASNAVVTVASGAQEFTGWFTAGATASGVTPGPSIDPRSPTALNTGAVVIRPTLLLNYSSGTGSFVVDYLDITEFDEDASGRIYGGLDSGSNLLGTVQQYDNPSANTLNKKPLKGYQTGVCYNGQAITFPVAFQNPPAMRFSRGQNTITNQPNSLKWSTPGSFSSSQAQIEDVRPAALSATGFTCVAQLVQTGTGSNQNSQFPTSNSLTSAGQTTQLALANVPSSNGHYTVRYTVTINVSAVRSRTTSVVVVVNRRAGGSGGAVTELRRDTYSCTDSTGAGATYSSGVLIYDINGTLATGDYLEVKIDSITSSGSGSTTTQVHGCNQTDDPSYDGESHTYGATTITSSMTWDVTHDNVIWEAWSWQ